MDNWSAADIAQRHSVVSSILRLFVYIKFHRIWTRPHMSDIVEIMMSTTPLYRDKVRRGASW